MSRSKPYQDLILVRHECQSRSRIEGVEQTARCMDRCAAEEGHLVVFDRSEGKAWEEKVFRREESSHDGRTIVVWGM